MMRCRTGVLLFCDSTSWVHHDFGTTHYLVEGAVASCELLLLLPLRHHLACPHIRGAAVTKQRIHSVRSGHRRITA
jgi:hypothetical protein